MTRPLRLVASAGISIPEMVREPQSFEDFFEAESPALFRRLCLITGNRHEAEEVMQDWRRSVIRVDGSRGRDHGPLRHQNPPRHAGHGHVLADRASAGSLLNDSLQRVRFGCRL